MTETTKPTHARDDIQKYAQAVCDGLNRFLDHGNYKVVINTIATSRTDKDRVTFTLTKPKTPEPSPAQYRDPALEYTVKTAGETLTFAYQDQRHLHVLSDAPDWTVFDTTEHIGELISCAVTTGPTGIPPE